MRPRYYIHKGIQKVVIAIGDQFVVGTTYNAALYNKKDRSVKVTATAVCYEVEDKNVVSFEWTGEQTDMLSEGFATIEIYDSAQTKMFVRDDFAVIRMNSLPIAEGTDES